jgi:hypothetical protein
MKEIPERCPKCDKKSELAEFPDTGTSIDSYELQCPSGHIFHYEKDNQTGEVVEIEVDE